MSEAAPAQKVVTVQGLERLLADRHLWLLLLLLIPALLPLAAPGYFFNAHDARHSVFWLVEFDRAVHDGALWPIWAPDIVLGFGYPLWLVYAPLAYMAAEGFHLLGLGFTVAVKATWALSFLLGALGMYALARRWWGRAGALIAALAYTYAPYHLAQIYVRGALAEFVALAIFPWTLLAFASLWDNPRSRGAAWAALALGALLLTHSGAAILFLPLLCGFLAVKALASLFARRTGSPRWWVKVGWSVLALALGVMLAAIFLVPLFLERRYVGAEVWLRNTYDYRLHFVYPSQFFDPTWGYGYSVPGTNDGMSFQLGLVPVLCAAVGALGAWRAVLTIRQSRRALHRNPAGRPASADRVFPGLIEAFFFVTVSGIAVFAMTPAAKPLWDTLPLISMIQFPWRLLALTVVMLALLSGAGAWWLEQRFRYETSSPVVLRDEPNTIAGKQVSLHGPFLYVAALAIVLGSFLYTRPQLVPVRPQDESPLAAINFEMQHPDMRGMTFWAERQPVDADSPLLSQYLAGQPLTKAAIVAGQGTILEQSQTADSATTLVRVTEPARLRFYTYYFPGWRATVDGQPVEIRPDPPNGLIGLDLPSGEHRVQLQFGATPVRSVSAALSAAGLALVAGLWLANRRRGDLRE